MKYGGTIDLKSFVFTFKDDEPTKYNLKKDMKKEPTFSIGLYDTETLFSFGLYLNHDIWVGKKGAQAYCFQNNKSFFDYRNARNALTDISTEENGEENKFDIKRVIVLQFK